MIIKVLLFVFMTVLLGFTGFALGDSFGVWGILMGVPIGLLVGAGTASIEHHLKTK